MRAIPKDTRNADNAPDNGGGLTIVTRNVKLAAAPNLSAATTVTELVTGDCEGLS